MKEHVCSQGQQGSELDAKIRPYNVEFRQAILCLQSSVQLLSRVRLFVTPWTTACQVSLSITNSQSLLRLMSIQSVMTSNHLILLYHSPPAFSLSQH